VLVLEDCHWIDPLSRDLLEVLGRATADLPVLIVLAYRPTTEPGGGLGVDGIPDFSEIVLDELRGEDAVGLIRLKLEQVAPDADANDIPDAFVELLLERSSGNPFYIEELLSWIVSRGVDPTDYEAVRALELPESLHSLVLSRIDSMTDGPRRTLKVASVVGRVFEAPVLPGAYPELGSLDEVLDALSELRTADLISLDRDLDHAYLFKHVATQEVAYESLPFGLRARLHGRIGTWLEGSDPDGVDRRLDLLAHHFWLSDDDERKRLYLGRAADAARLSYANASAISYLERLVPLLDGSDAIDALLKLSTVLQLVGDWKRADELARDAVGRAVELEDGDREGWARTTLAEVTRKQGLFDDANEELGKADELFRTADDQAGLGEVGHLSGTVAAQQGDLDWARKRYEDSLAIRERLKDRPKTAALYSNLAIVAEYSGDLEESRRMAERALQIRTEIGDRWAIGVSRNNLGAIAIREGRLEEARAHIREAIRLMVEVGDTWFAASSQVLLGNVDRDLGELTAAGTAYAASLSTFVTMDDRLALAELLEDVAQLATRTGRHVEAITLVAAAGSLRDAIGAPLSEALAAERDEQLATSVAAIGPSAAKRARSAGGLLDQAGAVDLAHHICTTARAGGDQPPPN
jgi:tetratricopeptide (TPR) repeat protein